MTHPTPVRRALAYLGLASLLGAVVLTLGQCTMVGDSLTGVRLSRTAPTTCIKGCNDTFADLFKAEQKRHIAAMEQCNTLTGQAQQDCKTTESATHSANKAQLTADKIACQNGCYHEGAGQAG